MIRFELHVHPGSRRPRVGGSYDGDLEVHVRARAVKGAATVEALAAVAAAFGVPSDAVTLERGGRSRTKLVCVEGEDATLRARLRELLSNAGRVAR
ncbi:MAG: DUF167 domain-containing protein [Acidimicrobiales bacterium]